jgi:SAM-dependent methyltransferase
MLEDDDDKIAVSKKDWTDNELGLNWLIEYFHPLTALSNSNTKCLLIIDGHESHYTIDFINFCDLNDIILLILPPHTTHYLQLLDVACFSPLACAYSAEIEYHGRYRGTYIDKSDFVSFYRYARSIALRSSNIDAGLRLTGLIPCNPEKIYQKLANAQLKRPITPPSQIIIAINANIHDLNTIRKIESFIATIDDVTIKQTFLDKIQSFDAENAFLSKINSELVANARRTKGLKKQLPTGARYLSKETANEIRAELAEKKAQKETEKA